MRIRSHAFDLGMLELLKPNLGVQNQMPTVGTHSGGRQSRFCETPAPIHLTCSLIRTAVERDVSRLNIHWKLCLLFAEFARRQQVQIKEERERGKDWGGRGNEHSNPTCRRKLSKWTPTTCCLQSRPSQCVLWYFLWLKRINSEIEFTTVQSPDECNNPLLQHFYHLDNSVRISEKHGDAKVMVGMIIYKVHCNESCWFVCVQLDAAAWDCSEVIASYDTSLTPQLKVKGDDTLQCL